VGVDDSSIHYWSIRSIEKSVSQRSRSSLLQYRMEEREPPLLATGRLEGLCATSISLPTLVQEVTRVPLLIPMTQWSKRPRMASMLLRNRAYLAQAVWCQSLKALYSIGLI